MNSIEGRAAVITGATRGIGLAIARALLDRGGRVFICARNRNEVDQTVASLKAEYGENVYGTACDVRSYESVHGLFSDVSKAFGELDILINNAGIGSHSYVEQMSVEEWKATIDTNLTGVFYCCHEALPLLKRSGGG